MSQVTISMQEIEMELPTDFPQIVHQLRAPVLSLKDTEVSSRMMNYYSTNNLLLDDAEINGKRKLTAAQILWISILKDLHRTGITNEVVCRIKIDCETFQFVDMKTFRMYYQLEYIAALIVKYKSDIRLLVLPEGSYTFINYSIASNLYQPSYYSASTHVSIPLFDKVQTVWKKVSQEQIAMKEVVLHDVSKDEKTVLAALRMAKGQIDDVVITLRRQETPKAIVMNQSIDPKTIEATCKFLRVQKNCSVTIAYGDTAGVPTAIRQRKTIKLPANG
jgi:DNA-binding transcriptional MerR regulator